jgi:hypothetical protein
MVAALEGRKRAQRGWISRTEASFGGNMGAVTGKTSNITAFLSIRRNALIRGDPNVLNDASGDEGAREGYVYVGDNTQSEGELQLGEYSGGAA